MMRRLDRYVLAEILGPSALGFLVYTVMLLIQFLFKSAEMIIRGGVPVATIGKLLMLSLPSIIVLTIPMALLFGVLIGIGRLSADSELTALRSSGISLFSLYRPILLFSAVLTGLTIYLMLEVLPQGNHALQRLRLDIQTQILAQEIEPRVPYTGWQDKVLYIFETPQGERRWKGTFFADSIPTSENQMILAEWGEALADDDGTSAATLSLENAFSHRVNFNNPERYDIIFHRQMDLRLDGNQPRQASTSVKRGLRELPLRDLKLRAKDPSVSQLIRNLAKVEIHKKFSIPAACMVFGLLALPLGFTNARGGKSSGFALSIGVIMAYYVFLNWGEEIASNGGAPSWLMVWLPNLSVLSLGLYLLARRNRDKSLMLTQVGQRFRQLWGKFQQARSFREAQRMARRRAADASRRARADLLLRVPELRLRFPNATDRYILRTFARVLVVAALSGLTVYIVADLTEKVDDVLKNNVPRELVLDYYKYKSFGILYEIAPVIVLVTTLVTFGLLSRTNEITAWKSLGISLYRLALPVVLASLLMAIIAGLLQSEILAASNRRVAELEAKLKGKEAAHRAQRADQRWLYGKGGYLYNFSNFDEDRQELQRLQVFKFDEKYRLTDRLYVQQAIYAGNGWWTFSDGWARSFDGTFETVFRRFEAPKKDRLPEPPEFFEGELRRPEEMRFNELRQYIEELRSLGGKEVPQLSVDLHNKIAYPIISLVMALVALPFAFRMGRHGALYGIGLSLVLGIVLLIFLALFSALGESGILPPAVAVWSPSVIFSIFSLYLFLGVRT